MDPFLINVMGTLLDLEFPPVPYDVMMEKVDQGLFQIGHPLADSPVLVTGNSIETVQILQKILTACEVNAFLVASDTKGYTVDNAIVEKRFAPFQIMKALTDTEGGSQVSHRTLMIPGLARTLSAQVRQFTNWEVIVGPVSGFEVPMFLLNETCRFV
jgi:acetyl-CoA decarbonylase/synthase complex subunit gamma